MAGVLSCEAPSSTHIAGVVNDQIAEAEIRWGMRQRPSHPGFWLAECFVWLVLSAGRDLDFESVKYNETMFLLRDNKPGSKEARANGIETRPAHQ